MSASVQLSPVERRLLQARGLPPDRIDAMTREQVDALIEEAGETAARAAQESPESDLERELRRELFQAQDRVRNLEHKLFNHRQMLLVLVWTVVSCLIAYLAYR